MGLKMMNRTVEEVERLSKLLDTQLDRINPNTLSDSERERLTECMGRAFDYYNDNLTDEDGDEEGEDDESL